MRRMGLRCSMRRQTKSMKPSPKNHKRASRHRRKERPRGLDHSNPLVLTILETLGEFVYLKTDQVTRLVASPGQRTHVEALLRRMYDHRLVVRIQLPVNNKPIIYTLDNRGARVLQEMAITPRRWRPKHRMPGHYVGDPYGYFKLSHPILANEILLRFILSARANNIPFQWKDAPELQKLMREVYPDKYLCLTAPQPRDVFIEADTGTQTRRQMEQKLERYLEYLVDRRRLYRQHFLQPRGEVEGWPVICIVTQLKKRREGSRERLEELCAWIGAYAVRVGFEDYANIYRLARRWDLAGDIIGGKVWRVPGRKELYPLFTERDTDNQSDGLGLAR